MKNILIIASSYPSKGDPYSSFIESLVEEMANQGVSVTVIARQSITWHMLNRVPFAPLFSSKVKNGNFIRIYRPLGFTDVGRLGPFARWFNRITIRMTARKLPKPDAVYAHFWQNGVYVIDYVRKNKLPFIVATGEDKIIADKISAKDKEWLKEHVQHVICVSSKNKQESIETGLAKEENCVVLPNAYNSTEFYIENGNEMRKHLGLSRNDFTIAFCGRWNERKGIFRLDAALKKLNNPHIKAIYIGNLMDNSKVEPDYTQIVFKGQLPHNEIVHYLNAADVFVLPSEAEGCPNSVIEAMACGLPVISSDLPFNYDILNSNNSILLDPNDVNMIAEKIDLLYQDRQLCRKLASGAINSAQSMRIDKRVERILKLLYKKS